MCGEDNETTTSDGGITSGGNLKKKKLPKCVGKLRKSLIGERAILHEQARSLRSPQSMLEPTQTSTTRNAQVMIQTFRI